MNPRLKILMLGPEEKPEMDGQACRSSLLARAFSRSEEVEKVLMVYSPYSVLGRIKEHRLGTPPAEINPKLSTLSRTLLFREGSGPSVSERIRFASNLNTRLKRMGFEDCVLWITNPRMVDIAQEIHAGVKIFDVIDDLTEHPDHADIADRLRKAYGWVETHADMVFTVSESLKKIFSKNKNVFWMPNGIDPVFLKETPAIPKDLSKIPVPRVIYAGVLQERMDTKLLLETARLLPDHHFVMIGPGKERECFRDLRKQTNIHFLGFRRYDELPAYLGNSDVCIIPHKVNPFTDSMNPLKIYEYLASGKPVVSTPVSGTEYFRKHIRIVPDAESFAQAVKHSVEENNFAAEQARREAVRPYSWDARAEQILQKIRTYL